MGNLHVLPGDPEEVPAGPLDLGHPVHDIEGGRRPSIAQGDPEVAVDNSAGCEERVLVALPDEHAPRSDGQIQGCDFRIRVGAVELPRVSTCLAVGHAHHYIAVRAAREGGLR